MIKSYKKIILSSLLSTLLFTSANATELEIENNTSSNVGIVIEGGTGTLTTNKEAIKQELKSGGSTTIQIDKATFGLESFSVTGNTVVENSVTGKTKLPSLNHNKCETLLVDKDYKILLIEGKVGVICKAIEKNKK